MVSHHRGDDFGVAVGHRVGQGFAVRRQDRGQNRRVPGCGLQFVAKQQAGRGTARRLGYSLAKADGRAAARPNRSLIMFDHYQHTHVDAHRSSL